MTGSTPEPVVTVVDWTSEGATCRSIRQRVFTDEQGIDAALDDDGRDAVSRHVLVRCGDTAVATGRLLPDGVIGRMAVLPEHRGRGLGRRLLAALVAMAREQGCATVRLSAQCHAEAFYAACGFQRQGEPYEEAGIAHVAMIRELATTG